MLGNILVRPKATSILGSFIHHFIMMPFFMNISMQNASIFFLRKKGNLNLWQQTQSKVFEQA